MRIIHRLRCKFDEPYRIKIGFGLSPLRNKREVKALIAFCKDELTEDYMKFDSHRADILRATVSLYENPDKPITVDDNIYRSVSEIVSDYCSVFWS